MKLTVYDLATPYLIGNVQLFREPTVLLLGAGASASYGLPLGNALKLNIEHGIAQLFSSPVPSGVRIIASDEFLASGYSALRSWFYQQQDQLFNQKFFEESIRQLHAELVSGPVSIDEFVRINPRWRPYVKVLLAFEIARCIYETSDRSGFVRRDHVFRDASVGWYRHLIHELRRGAKNSDELASNQLRVVTFNYDRSLEYSFELDLGGGQIFSGFSMFEAPRVIHVHGEIELMRTSFPGQQIDWPNFWPLVRAAADNFVMLDENRKAHSENTNIAMSNLESAKRIFVLGYDFHDQNNDLLSLGTFASKCIVLNWDGSQRVQRRATDLGIRAKNIISGSRDTPLSISAAIDDGLFLARP